MSKWQRGAIMNAYIWVVATTVYSIAELTRIILIWRGLNADHEDWATTTPELIFMWSCYILMLLFLPIMLTGIAKLGNDVDQPVGRVSRKGRFEWLKELAVSSLCAPDKDRRHAYLHPHLRHLLPNLWHR